MGKQVINIGASANDGTGDSLRVAGGKINNNFTELYGGAVLSSKIQDTAGTTFVNTEDATYPNQIIGKSTVLGTSILHQLFNGDTPAVPVYQIDGTGSILKDGNYIIKTTGVTPNGISVGTLVPPLGHSENCFYAGHLAGSYSNGSTGSIGIGYQAGYRNTGVNNLSIGYSAGNQTTSGFGNVFIGENAGYSNSIGSNNVCIGANSGKRQTAGHLLFIDAVDRGDAATELTDSLIVGTFDVSVSNQELFFNAQRISMRNLPSSPTGLTSGDLWNDAGTLKIV